MAYETKIYYGATQSNTLELVSVSGLQVSLTFSTSSQEGINAVYPITVTHNGKNTPQITISGEVRADPSAWIVDQITHASKTPNTLSDIWAIVSNSQYKFKIEPYKLATNNTITDTASKNYFMGYLKSLQFAPSVSYQSKEGYVGDLISYTMVFALTGD